VLLYSYGEKFLSSAFVTDFKYKQSCMFLQISNSSAILIFNARTQGFSFLSMPCMQLFMSAVVSQAFVNYMLLNSGGFIVEELAAHDLGMIWAYDLTWLIIIDLVKMAIIRIQDGPGQQATLSGTMTRNSFHGRRSGSRIHSTGGTAYKKIGMSDKTSVSAVRMSISGQPMMAKGSGQPLI